MSVRHGDADSPPAALQPCSIVRRGSVISDLLTIFRRNSAHPHRLFHATQREKDRQHSFFSESELFLEKNTINACEEDDDNEKPVNRQVLLDKIRQKKEVIGKLRCQPWSMNRKRRTLRLAQKYLEQNESRVSRSHLYKEELIKKWHFLSRWVENIKIYLIPWEAKIKTIESHFGSVVSSYFTFLRWVIFVNVIITLIVIAFVVIPEVLADAAADEGRRYRSLTRKVIPPSEKVHADELQVVWHYDGYLKYSPLFYGYYSNDEFVGGKIGYSIPSAYFLVTLFVFCYSCFAILRKMASNAKMSKMAGSKTDQYTFSWKVFIGWDYTIGNAETASNTVMAFIIKMRESIAECRVQSKDKFQPILFLGRLFANAVILGMLAFSIYCISFAVASSETVDKTGSLFTKNQVPTIVATITHVFPMIFDLIGTIERYHPRTALRAHLTRVLVLYVLNYMTLIVALFEKLDKIRGYEISKIMDERLLIRSKRITVNNDYNITLFRSKNFNSVEQANEFINRSTRSLPLAAINETTNRPNRLTWHSTKSNQIIKVESQFGPIGLDNANAILSNKTLKDGERRFKGVKIGPTPLPIFTLIPYTAKILPTNVTVEIGPRKQNTSEKLTKKFENNSSKRKSPRVKFTTTPMSLNRESHNISKMPTTQRLNDGISTSLKLQSITKPTITASSAQRLNSHSSPEISIGKNMIPQGTVGETEMLLMKPTETIEIMVSNNSMDQKIAFNYSDIFDKIKLKKENYSLEDIIILSLNDSTNPMFAAHNTTLFNLDEHARMTEGEIESYFCWETMIGQELAKLVTMDLIITIASIFVIDFFRGLWIRYCSSWWCWDIETTFPEYGEFKVAENVLHIINNQGMIWLGLFFSPLLPALNNIKLVIVLYIRGWACMSCNVPAREIFRASRSSNFYLTVLLLWLLLCTLPVGYVIASKQPSSTCGPFAGQRKFYNFIAHLLKGRIDEKVLGWFTHIASPGVVIPVLLLLMLIIYFLVSLVRGLREANDDLQQQLIHERTEEKKKIFELAGGGTKKKSSDHPEKKKKVTYMPLIEQRRQEPWRAYNMNDRDLSGESLITPTSQKSLPYFPENQKIMQTKSIMNDHSLAKDISKTQADDDIDDKIMENVKKSVDLNKVPDRPTILEHEKPKTNEFLIQNHLDNDTACNNSSFSPALVHAYPSTSRDRGNILTTSFNSEGFSDPANYDSVLYSEMNKDQNVTSSLYDEIKSSNLIESQEQNKNLIPQRFGRNIMHSEFHPWPSIVEIQSKISGLHKIGENRQEGQFKKDTAPVRQVKIFEHTPAKGDQPPVQQQRRFRISVSPTRRLQNDRSGSDTDTSTGRRRYLIKQNAVPDSTMSITPEALNNSTRELVQAPKTYFSDENSPAVHVVCALDIP